MALKIDTTYKGFPIVGAYVVVLVPTISMDKTEMAFNVQASATAGSEALHNAYLTAPYKVEGSNPFEQAYEYLKGLPEFAGATDC